MHAVRFLIAFILSASATPCLLAADAKASAQAVADLKAELDKKPPSLIDLGGKDFSKVPLTKADSAAARELLVKAHFARMKLDRADEMKAKTITDDKLEMPYDYTVFGEKPEKGHSLWISMHGGGGAPKAVNDQQWENQKKLYKLDEGIYLAPRAPTNTWNLWHDGHIDKLFDRLIENFIALEGVDPDRVYLTGYSAGGDGVYQLAPRMADRFAAAAMMAGHPNNANPLGLRNLPFALHMGANDAAYNRNKVAEEWKVKLDDLEKADPKGYVHQVKLHEGKGHWMDRRDAEALPWMAKKTREPVPLKVVWQQAGRTHDHFYWLGVPPKAAKGGSLVVVEREGQTVTITEGADVPKLLLRFDDRMLDLDKDVTVKFGGKEALKATPNRTLGTLIRTLLETGDPKRTFDAEVEVGLKK